MYDWRTDEDQEWTGQESREDARPISRRWLWLAVPLILILVAGGIYWRINRRLDETTELRRQDVLSSHALVQQAIDNQDLELLTTLLSGREPDWTRAQRRLVSEAFWDVVPLFGWTPAQGPEDDVVVAFDSELRQATVFQQRHLLADGQTVSFVTSSFYRLGEERWLWAPPEPSYWGNNRLIANDYVAIMVPARDIEFARLVLDRLGGRTRALCRQQSNLCPVPLEAVTITFTTDPDTMLTIASREHFLAATGAGIEVPTVSLLGSPQSDAATAALVNQYEFYLLTAILADWAGYQCCERGLFFMGLADQLLGGSFELKHEVTAAEYLQLAGEATANGSLDRLFAEPINSIRPDRWLAAGWAAYLVDSGPADSLAAALMSLNDAGDFAGWQAALPGNAGLPLAVSRHETDMTMLFAARQNIALHCLEPTPAIYLYDSFSASWDYALPPIAGRALRANLQPLPNQDGFFAAYPTLIDGEQDWLAYIWHDPLTWVEFNDSAGPNPLQYSGLHDPAGERLLVYRFDDDTGNLDFQTLELANCQSGDCPLREVAGLPIWSPSGRQSIVLQGANLWRGDENGDAQEQLYRALFPFWLTENTFGFLRAVRFSDDSGALVAELGVLVSSFGWEPQERLGTIDLANHHQELEGAVMLKIERAEPHQYLQDTLMVTASDDNREQFYVLEVTGLAANDAPTIRPLYIGAAFPARLHYGVDTRWLGITTFGSVRNSLNFTVIDRVLGRQLPPFTGQFGAAVDNNQWVHWSADGQTALLLSQGFLTAYRPADGNRVTIVFPYDNCRDVVWVTRP